MYQFPEVQLSVLTKFTGPLTKQLSLKNGKVHSDSSECRMHNGLAERIKIPFDQLPYVFSNLTHHQAVATGWVNAEPNEIEIVTREKFENHNYTYPAHITAQGNYATRTLNSFCQTGASLVMFDHDHDVNSPYNADTPEEFIKLLAKVIPNFDQTTFIRTYSTSSSIYHSETGECLRPADGFHIYMVVPDGSDLQRFGEVLEKRLWLAGLGYIKVSQRNASLLKRTIVDTAVFSPERLIFEAGAVILPGEKLVQRLPLPELKVKQFAYLDTHSVLDLTDDEEEAYKAAIKACQDSDLVQQIKAQVKDGLTEEYIEQARRQGRILSKRAAAKMVDGLEKHILPPFHPIMFSDGTQVSILELMSNPAKWDGRSCFDPLRPDKGPDRAKFFANAEQVLINPVVYSFVEGGRTFVLRESLKLLSQQTSVENSEDLREVSEHFETQNNRFLEPIQLREGWTFIKSDKGTGKTKTVSELIKTQDVSVLAITHRVSLTQSLSRDFDLACYNEKDVASNHVLRSQKRLGICYDSLHKIAGQVYDIVILDEVTQLMRHTKSLSVKNKFICLNVLRAILMNARFVIAMDADLSLPYIEILRAELGGCVRPHSQMSVVINQYKPAKAQNRQAKVYEKADGKPHERGWEEALINYLKDGNGTFVATNARVHTYNLANMIAKELGHTLEAPITAGHFITEIPGHRIITITSDNTGEEAVTDFVTNLNTRLLPTDILIASPSVGTGVSIDAVEGVPKFNRTFGRFTRRAGNISGDCMQHLSRVRECRHFDLVILDTKEIEPVDATVIIEDTIIKKLKLIDRQVSSFDLNFCPFRRQYVFMDGNWAKWFGDLTALENTDRNDFNENLINRLKDEGYNVETHVPNMTDKRIEELNEKNKVLAQERKDYDVKLLQEATLITDEELESLEKDIQLSMEEKRQIKKRKVADTFGAYDDDTLNPLLALSNEGLSSRRNGLMLGMNGETLFVMDLINRLDPEKQHIEKTAYYAKWQLIWHIASLVGISLDDEGLPKHCEMLITDDIRNAIYESLWEQRADVKILLGISMKFCKPLQFAERARYVGKVLSVCGFKLKRRKISATQYIYEVDPTRFNELKSDIERARTHCPGNSYKTLITVPKFLVSYVAQWAAGTPDRVKQIHSYVSRLQPHWAALFHKFMLRMVVAQNALAVSQEDLG